MRLHYRSRLPAIFSMDWANEHGGLHLMSQSESPPPLLPGRSALSWTRVGGLCLAGALAAFGLGLAGLLLLPMPARMIVSVAAFAVICVLGSGLILASLKESRATIRENAAGYTTVYQRHYELWQLNPRTGAVVRRPGERTYSKDST